MMRRATHCCLFLLFADNYTVVIIIIVLTQGQRCSDVMNSEMALLWLINIKSYCGFSVSFNFEQVFKI